MPEQPQTTKTEITVPKEIDEQWMTDFTTAHVGREATVQVEDWLEQPAGIKSPVSSLSSGYYELCDEMGHASWWQTLSGTVLRAAYTNVPYYRDTDTSNVLALEPAQRVLPSGLLMPLAAGRIVLVRLDRVKDGLLMLT